MNKPPPQGGVLTRVAIYRPRLPIDQTFPVFPVLFQHLVNDRDQADNGETPLQLFWDCIRQHSVENKKAAKHALQKASIQRRLKRYRGIEKSARQKIGQSLQCM